MEALVALKFETVVSPKLVIPEIYRLVEVTEVATVFTNTVEVAKRFVVVALVNTAVEAPVVPIGVLLIVPPSIVRPFTTIVSVMEFDGRERAPVTARFVEVMLLAAVFTNTVVVAKR